MAFELPRMHEAIASYSKNEPKIITIDDAASGYHISGGVDVPSTHHTHHFPSSAATSPAFQTEYSPPDLTPPDLWSFSPVVESSTCSTETESNEEDDDFMAGLAEQMTHLMLDNDDEDELGFPAETSNVWTSNWLPSITKPLSADTQPYKSCWLNGGWQASNSHSSMKVPFVPKCSSNPPTVQDGSLELLHSGVGISACKIVESMDSLSTQVSRQHNSEEVVGRKIEEFLWKQALNQAAQGNTHLPKDSSNVPCGSKAKPSYGSRAHRTSAKLREEDRKTCNNQGRYPRHVTQPTGFRHIRPHQQCSMGRMNTHSSRASDQRCARGLDLSTSPWKSIPNLNNGSSMRAVFLSGNGNGRESAGTGVFLPRCAGIGNDTKRKPVCSTVLLPSRIVQVLNLHVDDFHPRQYYPPAFTSSNEPRFSIANSGAAGNMEYCTHQDYVKPYPSSHLHQPSEAVLNLPIEWTY